MLEILLDKTAEAAAADDANLRRKVGHAALQVVVGFVINASFL